MGKTWNDLIIESAEMDAAEALRLIRAFEESDHESDIVYEAARNTVLGYLEDIRRIKQSYCQKEGENSSENLGKTDVDLQVYSLVHLYLDFSEVVTYLDLWRRQRDAEEYSSDGAFAHRLVRCILGRLELETDPRIVFGSRFAVANLGQVMIVEIPYVYMKRYARWLGIAHEVGHIYAGTGLEFVGNFDVSGLFSLLLNRVPEEMRGKEKPELSQLVINWATKWTPELISDFVSVAACGPAYIMYMIQESISPWMSSALSDHPPTDFRVACLIEAASQLGEEIRGFKDFRSIDSPIFAKLDPLQSRFVNEKLVSVYVKWMISQPRLSSINLRWTEFWRAADKLENDAAPGVPFEVEFGALALLEHKIDTKPSFEALKRKAAVDPE